VEERLTKAIIESYVEGLLYAHGLSLCLILVGILFALFLRDRNISK
jgi:hypothetical protein